MKFFLIPARELPSISCTLHETPISFSTSETIINLSKGQNYIYSDVSYRVRILWEQNRVPVNLQFLINGEIIDYSKEEGTVDELIINFKSEMYPYGNIFRDCYGYVQLEVYCEWEPDKAGISFWTDYFCVMLRKTKANESLQKMAEYVYRNHAKYIWKRNTLPDGAVELNKSEVKSLDTQIELIKEVIKVYGQNISILKTRPHTLAEHAYSIDEFEKLQRITPITINYIIQHSDELAYTDSETGIAEGRNNYIPKKTLILKTEQSRNCYENRVITGFLKSVLLSVNDLVDKTMSYIKQSSRSVIKVDGYISSAVFILETTLHNLETKLVILQELQSKLNQLYWAYKSFLFIDDEEVHHTPMLTAVFRMLPSYRQIYVVMDRWFSFGLYDFSGEEFLLPLLINHQLYEYYILIRLAELIEENGFRHLIDKDISYNYPTKNKTYKNINHNNTFYFSNDSMENVTLYYQPIIWGQQYSDVLRNGISLRRSTSLSLNKENEMYPAKMRNAYYTPDYVLKFQVGAKEVYVIIDAKYQTYATVWNQQIEKLSFKYQLSIHPTTSNSDLIGTIIFYGKSIEKSSSLENIHDIFWNHGVPAFWISSITESEGCTYESQRKTIDDLFIEVRNSHLLSKMKDEK